MKRALLIILLLCLPVSVWASNLGYDLNFGGSSSVRYEDMTTLPVASPSTLAFGNQSTSTTHALTTTYTNSGLGAWEAVTQTVTGTGFSLASTTCGLNPFDLASLASCTATVNFAPTSAGAATGALTASAPNIADVVVALNGAGVAPAGASDGFNRADAANLGSNWTVPTGLVAVKIVSNEAKATTNGGNNVEYWVGSDLTNDHCSKVTIPAIGGNNVSPTVRTSSAANTYYYIYNSTTLRRVVASSETDLTGGTGTMPTFTSGDIAEICIKGSTLTVAKNNAAVAYTYTDASPISTGYAGIILRLTSSSIDDWSGRIAP